ncbi:multicopper oxidase domain-containing protein [Nocardia tengchongensis]|uniref:multicopper oxidase family protein n=1 Tax=Nocardia tengchongensis TaxID=2055889 RepID=UPI0033D6027B
MSAFRFRARTGRPQPSSPVLSRRTVLRAAGLTAGAFAAGGAGIAWQLSGSRTVGATLCSAARLPEPFTLPGTVPPVLAPERVDATGDHYRIVQRRAVREILPGYRTEIWGYNGQFPGPTIRATRGRPAIVVHRNELEVPTVTHLHGGHTPAESDGYPTDYLMPVGDSSVMIHDDPQAAVVRGEREYRYPGDQPAATLWYHDHRMDFTGPAVWRGLAGFHLVDDDVDRGLGLPDGERDLPLLLCDRAFDADGQLVYPAADPMGMHGAAVSDDYMQGVQGDVLLVNGVPWPRFPVAAARYRLRWLNASNARVYRLRLDGPHRQAPGFIQIGSDGGLLDRPRHLDAIDIAPGERFDTIVDLTGYRPGDSVTIVNELGDGRTIDVLRLCVDRTESDSSRIPDRLAELERLDPATAVRRRDLHFRMGDMPSMPGHDGGADMKGWLIDGRAFDPSRPDLTARLGEVEIWRLTTNFNHPIHLHLNPFQVLTRNGRAPSATDGGWKDTIHLPASQEAEIAVRFTGYTGRFMLHCHNLEHEDRGMMANVAVTH